MSRKFGEREGRDDGGTSSATSSMPDPGKRTRTQSVVATGEGLGGGGGATNGVTNPLGGTSAIPMTGSVKVTTQTDQKAPDGTAETRKTVGVGELVYFTAETADKGSKWSTTAGAGKVTDGGSVYNWHAPSGPTSATITFDPGGGATATTVTMKVVAPDTINYSDKKEDTFGKGAAGAGMTNKLTFLPLSVCFWGTQWRETDLDGAATGWMTHLPADKKKHKAASPKNIGDDNSGPGDHASFSATGPFGEKGTLQWDIPQEYSVKGANNWQAITQPFTQLTSIETDGTVTVSKHGESVTHTP